MAGTREIIETTLYACDGCGAQRVFGAGKPSDPSNKPLLWCLSSEAKHANPTRHSYVGLGTAVWVDVAREEGA